MVKIDIRGTPTALTLYEVWEAIVALTSTCVRGRQREGKASSLGLLQVSENSRDSSLTLSRYFPQHISSNFQRACRQLLSAVIGQYPETSFLEWQWE